MGKDYNSTAFTPEEVKKKLHLDLINYLLDYNQKSEGHYNDIHLTTDGYCTIVEWVDKSFEYDEGEGFEFVDYNQRVMTECNLPDNSTVMCYDEDDVKETLDNWLKEHPGYYQNEYGVWCNKNEEKLYEKEEL